MTLGLRLLTAMGVMIGVLFFVLGIIMCTQIVVLYLVVGEAESQWLRSSARRKSAG